MVFSAPFEEDFLESTVNDASALAIGKSSLKKADENLQSKVLYLLVRTMVALLGTIPMAFGLFLSHSVARLFYCLDSKHRLIGMRNLSIAFPDRDDRWRRGVLKKSFLRLGTHAVDVAWFVRKGRRYLEKKVSYEEGRGIENYLEAKKEGEGVIFLTAHISSWELLPGAHALFGNPLSFVVRPLDNPFLDEWVNGWRSRFGNEVISKYGSLRPLLKRLKEGKDIGILIDQNVQEKDGVYAPLFGRPACTTASAAALAVKTRCPVVMGFLVPAGKRGAYSIRFYPPFRAESIGTLDEDVVHNTALFNHYL